jgi:ASC-1-like (ASCH) protein
MQHVAIMKKSWQMIPKILSGKKTIESRWYQTKRAPWNTIAVGDQIYFKNSGEPVTVEAKVLKVLQFELHSKQDATKIISKYGKDICLVNTDINSWDKIHKYCILIFLGKAKAIPKPFEINKTGFGAPTTWLSVPNIETIKIAA